MLQNLAHRLQGFTKPLCERARAGWICYHAASGVQAGEGVDVVPTDAVDMSADLGDAELLRYARQVLLDDWGIEAQLRLKAARVLVVGLGGLGHPAAQLLARAGVGRLTLVDADVVEASNLQRQILFVESDLGAPKALVAAKRLQNDNPAVQVDAQVGWADAASLPALLDGCDLVLDCTDNFASRDAINRCCVGQQKPLLSASAIGVEGQLALFLPGQACYACAFGVDAVADARRCADTGVLASTPVVMGSLQAHQALLFLGLGNTALANRLWLWDGVGLHMRSVHVQRDPLCPVCRPLHQEKTDD